MVKRRWLKIGTGMAYGIVTILGLFQLFITLYGFQITDLTGDIVCEGTYDKPCISEFNVRNPNPYFVDIYSKDQVKLDFSPNIKDYGLYVKDGRCRSTTGTCACELKDGSKLGFKGWRCTDFTNKTKPRKDKVYNFRFPAYTTKQFLLAGIKNNPKDTIKWGFGTGEGYLDPVWNGTGNVSGKLGTSYSVPVITYKPTITDLKLRRYGDKLNITWNHVSTNVSNTSDFATIRGFFYYLGNNQRYSFAQAAGFGVTYDTWLVKDAGTSLKWGGIINVSQVSQPIKDNGFYVVFELIDKSDNVKQRIVGGKLKLDEDVYLNWKDHDNPLNQFRIHNKTTIYMTNNGTAYHDTVIYDPLVEVLNVTANSVLEDVVCDEAEVLCHLNMSDSDILVYLPIDTNGSLTNISVDFSGNNLNAVWSTGGSVFLKWVEGKFGGAVTNFNIANDQLTITDPGLLRFDSATNDFSLSLWHKRGTLDDGGFSIIEHLDGGNDGYRMIMFQDEIRCSIDEDDMDSDKINDLNWHHIGCAFNRSSGVSQVYVDGVASGSAVDMTGNAMATTANVVMGIGTQGALNGTIDEIMIINRSLSPGEFAELYASTLTRFKKYGNHTIKPINVSSGFNSVNVNVTHSNQPGTNLSTRVGYMNSSVDNLLNLSLYLNFDFENKVWDLSGTGYDGTNNGATWGPTTGINSTGGYDFEASEGDYLAFGTGKFDDNPLTIALWIQWESIASSRGIMGEWDGPGDNWIFFWKQSIQNFAMTGDDAVGDFIPNLGQWYHVVMVQNTTTAMYYVDGELNSTSNDDVWTTGAQNFNIGSFEGTIGHDGLMDEVMVFQRELSLHEIQTMYNRTKLKYQTIVYTPAQNMTSQVNTIFTISNESRYLFPDIDYHTDSNLFWSPILLDDIIMTTLDNFSLFISSNLSDTFTDNPVTVTLSTSMRGTDYALLVSANSSVDTLYSYKQSGKTSTTATIEIEDDTGVDEAADVMYAAIKYGNYMLTDDFYIECGSSGNTNFALQNAFPDTNYATIIIPPADTDSPACAHEYQSGVKQPDTVNRFCTDDAGSAEGVGAIDYCVFTYGEVGFEGFEFKTGTFDVGGGGDFNITFTTPFADTEYVVFTTHSDSAITDVCLCEIVKKNTTGFNVQCRDDAGGVGDCNGATENGFDYAAMTLGDMNFTLTPPPILSTIELSLITPTSSLNNWTQNTLTNVTIETCCRIEDCGEIEMSLDPINQLSPPISDGFFNQTTRRGGLIKFSLGDLDPQATEVYSAKLCLWRTYAGGTLANATNISRFVNQSWEQTTVTVLAILNGEYTNITVDELSSTADEKYSCINVTEIVKTEFGLGNENVSIRLLDDRIPVIPGTWRDDFYVYTGNVSSGYLRFNDLEDTGSKGKFAYLNVSINVKGGLVSNTPGAKPFWTAQTNPNTTTLNQDECVNQTWIVNASGIVSGINHTFFAYINLTRDPSNSNITSYWNVTIVSGVAPSLTITINHPTNTSYPVADSLDFNVTGNVNIDKCDVDFAGVNRTMDISTTTGNYTNKTMAVGSYTARFYCNDTDGNRDDDTQIGFTVIAAVTDTCSCPGIDTDWEINLTDGCQINSSCDIGTGLFNWTDIGNFYCNATLNGSRMVKPIDDQNIWIRSSCIWLMNGG